MKLRLQISVWLILILLGTGCATVKYEYSLPPQDINSPPVEGKTRVIFYNTTNVLLFPGGTWRVGLKINDVGIENLHVNKYVQLHLSPGKHILSLSHVDVFTFRDNYEFIVGSRTMYIKVFNGITSTKYEIQPEKPEDFDKKYKPVSRQSK